MKGLLFIFIALSVLLSLSSCGGFSRRVEYCNAQQTEEGTLLTCGNEQTLIPNGRDGADGRDGSDGADGTDGIDGTDGADNVMLTKVTLADDACAEVYPGIYAENIHDGEIFDVYYNDSCTDSLGEYCDNVKTSYGDSGRTGDNHPGSSTVCWVDNLQLSGIMQDNGDILLYILDFN